MNRTMRLIIINYAFIKFMCKKFFLSNIIRYLCSIGYYIRKTKKKCYRLTHFYVKLFNAESEP